MFIHKNCKAALYSAGGVNYFCEVCDRWVEPDEIEEVDTEHEHTHAG